MRISLLLTILLSHLALGAQPLRVHPQNGNYFMDRNGKAIVLTGSHTWANFQEIGLTGEPLFDWKGYLDMMQQQGHNFMRMWVWEQAQGAAWTADPIRFSPLPYATVNRNGKIMYDLSKWNEEYFTRLRQRVTEAGQRGIYVSVMLFQGWAQNKTNTPGGDPWPYHPFNPANNINGVGKGVTNLPEDDEDKGSLHSSRNGDVLKYQEAYVLKVIQTLNDLDNVLYEILNEGGTKAWQYHIIRYIRQQEKNMSKQHPVGMTHAISVKPVMLNDDLWNSEADWISPAKEPQNWIVPGSTFMQNYEEDPPAGTGKKIVLVDTDHLWGHGGNYRWAWKCFTRGLNPIFMDPWQHLAGRLDKEKMDWMFIKGGIAKDTRDYPDWEPLRQNMGYIRKLSERLNLANMKPMDGLSSTRYCLANPGKEYVIYFPSGGTATLDLRAASGNLQVEWFIPSLNRSIAGTEPLKGGNYAVVTAPFTGDAVLYLVSK